MSTSEATNLGNVSAGAPVAENVQNARNDGLPNPTVSCMQELVDFVQEYRTAKLQQQQDELNTITAPVHGENTEENLAADEAHEVTILALKESQANDFAALAKKLSRIIEPIETQFNEIQERINLYNQAGLGFIITGPSGDGNERLDPARMSFLQAIIEPLGAEVRQLGINQNFSFFSDPIEMTRRAPGQTNLLATQHRPTSGIPVNLSIYDKVKLRSLHLNDVYVFEKLIRDLRREGVNGLISSRLPFHIMTQLKELNFERGVELRDVSMENFTDQEMYDAIRHSSLCMTSIQAKAFGSGSSRTRTIPAWLGERDWDFWQASPTVDFDWLSSGLSGLWVLVTFF
jgi:hypothetical protein